jgi:hypothetical protein
VQIGVDGDDAIDDVFAAQAVNRVAKVVASLVRAGYPATSTARDFATNRRVGGAYFSQHRALTAADFEVAPQKVPAFVEAARREGLRVVDEMSRPGHGPHMHVQLYRAGQTPARLFTGQPFRPVQLTEAP